MILSVIIPTFNEKKTIKKLIQKIILQKKIKKQIIVVDDCSNDGTEKILRDLYKKKIIDKLLVHKKNMGKGSAISTAKKYIRGDITLIQDADLEYSPSDYYKLINPILNGKSLVVYGSRVLNKKRYTLSEFNSFLHVFGNHFLTTLSNILCNQTLTDAHTCYKVFKSSIFKKITLEEEGFSFCPEVTVKISKLGIKIDEIPIKYKGRNIMQGKKIRYVDGLKAILTLLKYKYLNRSYDLSKTKIV